MQQRIINRVESDVGYRKGVNNIMHGMEGDVTAAQSWGSDVESTTNPTTNAILLAASKIAKSIKAKAIVSFTLKGSTVIQNAKERPPVPILAITPCKETARRLAMVWGVYGSVTSSNEGGDNFNDVLKSACRAALDKGLVQTPEDLLVVTAGLPFGTKGVANTIRVLPAAGPACWDGECRV